MTLSLDDVRNKRFRMARKNGYEVLEVDEFVDEVEESFAQLAAENENLRKQVDALRAAGPTAAQQADPPSPSPEQPAAEAPTAPESAKAESTLRSSEPNAISVTSSKEASSAVVRLVEMATEQAERLVDEANDDANRIREEANRTAHQVTTDARTRAERVESEARVSAERVQADAVGRAEKLDRDLETRRSDMFGSLEKQRDELADTVASLRSFESTYRSTLTAQLRDQIEVIESGQAEPAEVPESVRDRGSSSTPAAGDNSPQPNNGTQAPADTEGSDRDEAPTLGGGTPGSNTPRLDALLGDQR